MRANSVLRLVLVAYVVAINPALAKSQSGKDTKVTKRVDDAIKVPQPPAFAPSPFDTVHAKYIPGTGYLLTTKINIGLEAFTKAVQLEIQSRSPSVSFTTARSADRFDAALRVMKAETLRHRTIRRGQHGIVRTFSSDTMFVSVPTPSAVTTTLAGIELMLDDLLNRVNSGVSSALFAMRSHVAATISDLNVVFRNQMNETFDRLNEQEQKIITQAQVLAAQAQQTLQDIEENGFEHASDLVCQTTAGFANYNIGLPIKQFLKPDLLCLRELNVRDVGPQQEQLLTFRGVRLMPEEEYPTAKVTVSGQVLTTTTGGGDSVLQMPLAGGVNGAPNDTSLRGDRIAQAEFAWPKSSVTRRWLFTLKPYLVRSLDALLTPLIKGPIRRDKTQICYVHADGGSLGSREEYATCTILADSGWEIEGCSESSPTTANGDAGIRNRLFSVGACTWELRAKSKSFYGAGAWYGYEGRARMKQEARVRGQTAEDRKIVNQNDTSAVFIYPETLVPPEYQILQGDWRWQLNYQDNTGRSHSLTDTQPSEPHIGTGAMGSGVLTYTVLQ